MVSTSDFSKPCGDWKLLKYLIISLFDYIKDIFSGKREMTRLSIMIAQKASVNPT
jgi:hypothetical protein